MTPGAHEEEAAEDASLGPWLAGLTSPLAGRALGCGISRGALASDRRNALMRIHLQTLLRKYVQYRWWILHFLVYFLSQLPWFLPNCPTWLTLAG